MDFKEVCKFFKKNLWVFRHVGSKNCITVTFSGEIVDYPTLAPFTLTLDNLSQEWVPDITATVAYRERLNVTSWPSETADEVMVELCETCASLGERA